MSIQPNLPASGASQTTSFGTAAGQSDTVRAELAAGLLAPDAHISPKYLYDALGSRLFEAICALPEYYPTRTEAAIFDQYMDQIAQSVGAGATLIDLGAGNCAKAVRMFPALQPAQYVAVDISVDFMREALAQVRQRFPQIEMTGLGMDFSAGLSLPASVRSVRRVFFYAGSSIGNFSQEQALLFLRGMRAACAADGGLLIGVDLIKDKAILDTAYDDAFGVTAAFNLNLLRHLNQLLGTDFDVRDWQHRAFFNTGESRIEMHLEARSDLVVRWPGAQRSFAQGQRIHTENSYKYTPQAFCDLLAQAGFGAARVWIDARGWFAVMHARAI